MTWEPADRQVSYKKACTHFPFVVQWKHHCSCNGVGWGWGQLSQEAGTWQLCHLINLQTGWLEVFCLLLCLSVDFGSGVTDSHRSQSVVEPLREQSWRGTTILRHIFIFIIAQGPGIHHVMALSREHHGENAMKSERWDAEDKRREKQNPNLNSFPRPFTRLNVMFSADLILDHTKTVH